MTTLTLGRLRAAGEAFLRELGEAHFLELTGAPGPSPRDARERSAFELGPEAIDLALDFANSAAAGTPEERSARSFLAWLTGLAIGRAVDPIDTAVAQWRAQAVVHASDGQSVAFDGVDDAIAGERDHAARVRMDRARGAMAARDLVPLFLERRDRERDTIEKLDIERSPLEVAERLGGAPLAPLTAHVNAALQQSADVWRDTLADGLRKRFALTLRDASHADVIPLLDPSRFDGAFRISGRDAELQRIITSLGLDPDANRGLRIDRPSRGLAVDGAAVVAVDVPNDVRVVLGATGGVDTLRAALREVGRALRLAHVEGDAPFEHRWLGDEAVARACGHLLPALFLDERWLMRAADLARNDAHQLARLAATRALFELRRSGATHLYHVQALEQELAAGSMEELYMDLHTSAIGVPPRGADAFVDAPRILELGVPFRALQASAVLGDELVERFDVDWYRNPRVGPWLVQCVFSPARGELAGEMVARTTGRQPSVTPYITRLERVLAA